MNKSIYIKEAIYVSELSVCLVFNDDTKQTIDIGDYIRKHPHPQYNKYLQPKEFMKFKIEDGNIVWGKNWDLIFPVDQLYKGLIN